ncbi:GNAT superfamily N-acetyltransferase [Aeromonas sp. BIGb0405]|uniref:GNAT family N-acetyltransferase n=1 Tax=Aeromonas TaxID=642 RepID=UPI001CCE290F|nr:MULTISPECIES: GNAT family N-acetyltransferase [Aeromonas]MCS3454778.1 GNAT superfamily N-acetyltransferase [Aeromonas sp. BIGb0405]UBO74993.1 GNAT family N-acetyltransferase [Aeromonas rivuli]
MTSLRLKPACLDLYPEFALACHRDAWCISHGSVAGFDEAQTRVWLDTLTREQPQGLLHLWRHHSPIGQLELAPAMARMDGSLGGYIYLLYLVPQWRGRGLGRWLLEQALQRIRAAGSTSAGLRYVPTHLAAECFYLRQGWRKEGRADERGQLLVKDLTPLMPPMRYASPLSTKRKSP